MLFIMNNSSMKTTNYSWTSRSSARSATELILGSMGTEQAICRSSNHKNDTPRFEIQSYSRYRRYVEIQIRIRISTLTSDSFDISAPPRPPELILGSMGTEQAICRSSNHKNDTPRFGIQRYSRYRRYVEIHAWSMSLVDILIYLFQANVAT